MQAGFVGRLASGLTIHHTSAAGWVRRRLVASAVCLLVAACATSVASPSATGPTSTTPARAVDNHGQYQLVFELPRKDWRASDAITGEATLSLIGSDGVDFGASGSGPIAFSFDEVGGSRHAGWTLTADCQPYHLDAGQSISAPIKKSGGYSEDASPTDFNRWFLTDPLVHLPVGDWTITGVAYLSTWPCSASVQYSLHAAVVVHVTA
jgi:hypothetical protein